MKEKCWEFHEACIYNHLIQLILNKGKVCNQRTCWKYSRANFEGKLFDSIKELFQRFFSDYIHLCNLP